jgi:CheY-like chemotaxis protein
VIDDDPKAIELITLCAEEIGGTVSRANGGKEGIASALRDMPDLIVLDLMMPEVSGFDVVAALHDEPRTSRIPILAVTAKQITDADRLQLNGRV